MRALLNVTRLRDFERFLRACAIRAGGMLNMSDLGRDVGISPTAAREWMGVLHASGQVILLEPYHRNLGKRLAKRPKLYFSDTGLAAYLCGLATPAALASSPLAGPLWENHVIGQWIRRRDWHEPGLALWYWQDQTKNEVDLVVERDQKLYPVECKRKERPDPSDLKGIHALTAFYGRASVGHAYVACLCSRSFDLAPGVSAVRGWSPWDMVD